MARGADELGEARRKAYLRLECLRLAMQLGLGNDAEARVAAARTLAAFVIGEEAAPGEDEPAVDGCRT